MERRYKARIVDLDSGGATLEQLIVNESQKKVIDYLVDNDYIPEWLNVVFEEEEAPCVNLT